MMNHEECIMKIIKVNLKVKWSSLCDFSDAYLLVKQTVTVTNTVVQGQTNNCANKKIIFKNFAPFTSCISRINNTQADSAL